MLKERRFKTDINMLKYEVCEEVARYAFQGTLEEKREKIPYTIIDGITPKYRCCVYKEREIIRQRIRLAEGKTPVEGIDNGDIVQVVQAACEGCPINRFSVTNNCQMCLAKNCLKECKFDAISFKDGRAKIDSKKCRECGQCAKACQYNAIADIIRPCKRSCPVDAISMDENMIAVIDKEKCISCGKCVMNCPFGALSDKSFFVDVINEIKAGKPVYAMVAPSIEGQYGSEVSLGMIRAALKDLGFKDMYEVALGADLVSDNESNELLEAYNDGKKLTTSCCPGFVNLIKKHYPKLINNVSSSVSPMQATSRYIKAVDSEAICVFIGPCIAKKSEVTAMDCEGGADYAITFEELMSMFDAKNIDPIDYNEDESLQQASKFGKNFAISGGVAGAVMESLKEKGEDVSGIQVFKANGADDCRKALLLLKAGRLKEDIIEGMVCDGGCVGGPCMMFKDKEFMHDRNAQIDGADDRGICDSLNNYKNIKVSVDRD